MMQSWEWGDVKSRLGWEPFRIGVMDRSHISAGAQVLVKHLPLGVGTLAYIPRGPIGCWRDPETAARLVGAIHVVARRNHAVLLKIEPGIECNPEVESLLLGLGFRNSPVANQPCATIVMDITPPLEVIARAMRDSTRRKIQNTERKGTVARMGTEEDLAIFYRLMQITARRAGFPLRSLEYYEAEFSTFYRIGQAALFLAEYNGEVTAAHIAYAFGAHAAFFHQASANNVPALNPNCLLVWEEIKWAKSKGCCTYDLWGIPDEISTYVDNGQEPNPDRQDGLWGVYRFKSGFSKNTQCYMGALDYVYSPLAYRILNQVMDQAKLETMSAWLDTRKSRRIEETHGNN